MTETTHAQSANYLTGPEHWHLMNLTSCKCRSKQPAVAIKNLYLCHPGSGEMSRGHEHEVSDNPIGGKQ